MFIQTADGFVNAQHVVRVFFERDTAYAIHDDLPPVAYDAYSIKAELSTGTIVSVECLDCDFDTVDRKVRKLADRVSRAERLP